MNKILLTEDDESFGYILKEYLELNGFKVKWVRNGTEGLKEFEQGIFELCIV